MKKPVVIRILAVLSVLGLGSFIYLQFFATTFEYAGTVEATRVDLPSRVATVIKEVLVEEGQLVKKDQDLTLANALAKENYVRAVNLKKTGSISKEAFDLAENKKDDAQTRVDWCEIKAPTDATVLDRYLEPGEWANPGTKIVAVANLNDLYAYFYVPQDLMSSLKVGDTVTARVPEIKREYQGHVIKINDEAEFTPKNVQTQAERTRLVFGIKIGFKNQDGQLKPGMTLQSVLKK